jgi:hypothetical protein
METIRFVPEQNLIVFRNLNGLKPPWMDVLCHWREGMNVFLDVNHFFGILVKEISREIYVA